MCFSDCVLLGVCFSTGAFVGKDSRTNPIQFREKGRTSAGLCTANRTDSRVVYR